MATVTDEIEESASDDNAEEEIEVRSSFPTWADMELKYKIAVAVCGILVAYIGYNVSIIISIILALILLIAGVFLWFSSTNLSVEITVFMAKFFPPSKQCVWDCASTPGCEWSAEFRKHWKVIYKEYLEFEKRYNYCPQMDDVYPNGSITNWDRKWPTVNLRCYGLDTQISKYFPETMKLVNASDTWLSHVMFSILRPNKFIPRHRGPYRGVFRYHLHLEIPEYSDHEKELYLAVWPDTSSSEFWSPENVPSNEPVLVKWNDGDDFLFDDTCVHEVINFTKKRRIILFMDVERHDISFFAKCVHRVFMNTAKYLPAVQNCKAVQDDYLKKCVDEETKLPTRFGSSADRVDVEDHTTSLYDSLLWMRTAPEILPYKKARAVIESAKAKERLRNGQPAQHISG